MTNLPCLTASCAKLLRTFYPRGETSIMLLYSALRPFRSKFKLLKLRIPCSLCRLRHLGDPHFGSLGNVLNAYDEQCGKMPLQVDHTGRLMTASSSEGLGTGQVRLMRIGTLDWFQESEPYPNKCVAEPARRSDSFFKDDNYLLQECSSLVRSRA